MPSAAILAGGRARRFGGRDKSRLVVDGRSILDRQIAELSALADEILIVGPTRMWDAPVPAGVGLVADRLADCGPLGGLDAAFGAARHDTIVLVACDMPFVTAGLLGHLLSVVDGADAAVPRTDRGYHPLCAVYTRRCAPEVAQLLAENRLAMQELLERVRLREVGLDEIERFGPAARLLANVNSPAEFDELHALPGHTR